MDSVTSFLLFSWHAREPNDLWRLARSLVVCSTITRRGFILASIDARDWSVDDPSNFRHSPLFFDRTQSPQEHTTTSQVIQGEI